MRRSLLLKFIIFYILFGILGFAAIAVFSSSMCLDYLINKRVDELYSLASYLSEAYTNAYLSGGSEDLVRQEIKEASVIMEADIWIIDSRGRILLNTGEGDLIGKEIEGFDPTLSGNRKYTIGDYHGVFSEEVLSVGSPIVQGFRTRGYVILHLPVVNISSERNAIMRIIYISGGIIFILSLMILLLFYFVVYNPLRLITDGATKYAAGDYRHKISLKSRDEIGYLAETLNFMSDEISKNDEYQRQFIANVSHDFRSPLTSIKGYLVAILDGTIPREMEGKYLNRLISETERLSKLTQSMLTQNSIDQATFLNRSNFDINRAIRDVCASFEMVCREKNITFSLIFAEKREMVYADYPKIQQVLYNLIDNALKFSFEGSAISVSTDISGQKVLVTIKDKGIGISQKDIVKIWDRFYKTDKSRGKDKRGAGLGLSIVKSIINAHGESIDCVSTEGVGTEFTFSLPVLQPDLDNNEQNR